MFFCTEDKYFRLPPAPVCEITSSPTHRLMEARVNAAVLCERSLHGGRTSHAVTVGGPAVGVQHLRSFALYVSCHREEQCCCCCQGCHLVCRKQTAGGAGDAWFCWVNSKARATEDVTRSSCSKGRVLPAFARKLKAHKVVLKAIIKAAACTLPFLLVYPKYYCFSLKSNLPNVNI